MQEEVKYEVKVVATLTKQDWDNLIVTAFEGGINYWAETTFIPDEALGDTYSEACAQFMWDTYWDDNDEPLGIEIFDKETKELLGELTVGKVLETLKNYPDLSHAIHSETYDAATVDEIVQRAVLNEIVFG